ncbi:hypothetical protein SCP_0214780 [Sparassis crispa]|uniref:Uncharacterized protein n=1 Tax=Sparassis crispa TaxID=139825 RepID=A0A401GDP9_9APHY|nr:hypothetical protein SCP_0214780 [Sparassis crispa]GBE80261.1 hypothetical protein SCP_0214780 [Sparassis crispa]
MDKVAWANISHFKRANVLDIPYFAWARSHGRIPRTSKGPHGYSVLRMGKIAWANTSYFKGPTPCGAYFGL